MFYTFFPYTLHPFLSFSLSKGEGWGEDWVNRAKRTLFYYFELIGLITKNNLKHFHFISKKTFG